MVAEKTLLVIGAGGHGKVVVDCANAMARYTRIVVSSNRPERDSLEGVALIEEGIALQNASKGEYDEAIVAIGDNSARRQKVIELLRRGVSLATLVHPDASVSERSQLSPGVVVLAKAVVNANASVGVGCIVNTGAIVEHDCKVGDYVHLSPGAVMGGYAEVGDMSWLCMGSLVSDHVRVGERVVLGAGGVLLESTGKPGLYVGIPAKLRKEYLL